jgi:hypothetical protein
MTSLSTSEESTTMGYQVFQQLGYVIGRVPFDPYRLCGFSILSERECQLPGVELSEHLGINRRGIY